MFCIIAFIVLSILGIFSASNRQLAREALDCVFRRVTLRPCNTGFDEKMKAKILGTVITRSETAAIFLNKNFELLSWTFFVLLLASSIWTVRGGFLFYTTGSCNGANSSGFCVFDPKGENNQVSASPVCKVPAPGAPTGLGLNGIDLSLFPALGSKDATKQVVMIGCYSCDYTRKAYPMIRSLVDHYQANFVFLHYPVKEKTDYSSRLGYCVNQQAPAQYWKLNDMLFTTDKANLENEAYIQQTVTGLGLDYNDVKACMDAPQTQTAVQQRLDEIAKTNFYGTPTVFINGQSLVGPKPYRVYAIALEGLFYWLR